MKFEKMQAAGNDYIYVNLFGRVHSPYIWLKCPANAGTWEFFDRLLQECLIVI